MSTKQRLSASVDAELIEAVQNAVAQGRFDSVSAWVNDALRLKLAHDRRLDALRDFIAGYESDQGEITFAEIEMARRRAGADAIPVRGKRGNTRLPRRLARRG